MDEITPTPPAKPLALRASETTGAVFETPSKPDGVQRAMERELQMILKLVLFQLKRMLNFDSAAIYDYDGNLSHLMVQTEDRFLSILSPPSTERMCQVEADLARQVLAKGQTLIIQDLNFLPQLAEEADNFKAESLQLDSMFSTVRSWLGVPLEYRGIPLGMLALRHHQPGYFFERHSRLARTTIDHGIQAHSRLFNRAQVLAVFEERQRIARDLHDSVTQVLYGIELGINTSLTLLELAPERVAAQLRDVLNLAESGMADMRALLLELHPENLAKEGLVAAMVRLVVSLQTRQITVEMDLCDEPAISINLKEAVYRITQEALNNIIKHARATRVELSLAAVDAQIKLRVKDNGQGFDTGMMYPGHWGLSSMRERTQLLKGQLELTSTPGTGTLLKVTIPVTVSG